MNKERVKKYIVTFLKISIAILAVWYLFKSGRLTKESFIKLFRVNNIPFIILSAFAFLGSQLLAAMRLISLLRTIDFSLGFFQGFKLTMIGMFFNMVIPGIVGGDLVKGYYLINNEENSKGRSLGIVVMDRLLGLLAIVFIGGLSVVYLLNQNSAGLSPYRNEIYIILLIVSSFLGMFVLFLIFGGNQRVRGKLKEIFTKILRKRFFYHTVGGFGAPAKNRRVLFYSFLISLAIQLTSLAGILVLVNVLFEPLPGVISLFSVSAVVILLGIIPVTPGNIGWTELVAAYGWSAVGSNAGAEIFLYWRIVIVFCSLSLGLPYFFMIQSRKQMLKAQKDSVIQKIRI